RARGLRQRRDPRNLGRLRRRGRRPDREDRGPRARDRGPAGLMELGTDTKAVLLAAGIFFLWALLLGVWKYRQMATSPEGQSHPYVDIAHRAALLYSFAGVLLAVFVELSGWSEAVNLIAAFAVIGFMVMALSGYVYEGIR